MGKMDERPTQRHIVTGDVSEDRTWHSTGRLDEGEEGESEVTREARAGREGGENEVEETRGREAPEEKVEGENERGCGPNVEGVARDTGVEEAL